MEKSIKILLIDEDDCLRKVIEHNQSSEGFEVISNISDIATIYSQLYSMCKEGLEKSITLCDKHLNFEEKRREDMIWNTEQEIIKKLNHELLSSDLTLKLLTTQTIKKYDPKLINSGNAPELYLK